MQIIDHIKSASSSLEKTSDSARLDAEVLLAYSLKKNRTWLATWPEKELTDNQSQCFLKLLSRRQKGEPIAHITASREFWSLDLKISKDTLIPRPETELMIEQILNLYPSSADIKLLDLGTGSGAIALALASERPDWNITASDKSNNALQLARQNAQQLNLNNVDFISGSWFEPFKDQKFDIIASNPPYISSSDPHLLQGDVRFEPVSALASGEDGLDDIRMICQQAGKHLTDKGLLIIEHGFDQKAELEGIFINNDFKNIMQYTDLSGNPRLTSGITH